MTQTVVGIFKTNDEAQAAIKQLLSNGFNKDNVDISSGGSTSTGEVSPAKENESGVGKFFKDLFGGDNDESDRYTNVGKRGSIVTVHTTSTEEAKNATALLDQYGAVDVDDENSQYSGLLDKDVSQNSGGAIPVIEEKLLVGKREVETGGVRLRSRIIEKPVEESLRLREEHVRVERKTVDRIASEADLANFKEGTIELSEYAEVPVVTKEARIIEEVSLGKDVEHRDETINDTVRKTEVDIEELESDLKNRSKL